MANVDKQDFLWNGKLVGAVNLIYSDLINVDVVKPPYSNGPRNTSFFLQTRLGYIAERAIQQYMREHFSDWGFDYVVEDVETIWDTNCSEETGILGVVIRHNDKIIVLKLDIEDGCVVADEDKIELVINETSLAEKCPDIRLLRTTGPYEPLDRKDFYKTSYQYPDFSMGYSGIQINRLDGGQYRGYFTTKWIDDEEMDDEWVAGLEGCYITVSETINDELSIGDAFKDGAGMPGQTRMIIGISEDRRELILDDVWDGLLMVDEDGNTSTEVQGKHCQFWIYRKEKDTYGISVGSKIYMYNGSDDLTMYQPTKGNIISMVDNNGRVFALYDNGWLRYSTVGGRDKFLFNDELYVGEDKTSLYAFKDTVIAFGKRKTSVVVPSKYGGNSDYDIYFTSYEQSATIGLWSRYSYGEHDGNLMFVSNDKRLMTIEVAEVSGKYMLQLHDKGQEIINAKLSLMLDTDEAFIADFNNNLSVIICSKPSPDKEEAKNTLTHIYKFDSIFSVWTEDHLRDITIHGYKYGVWYGKSGVYIRGLVKQDNNGKWHITQDGREGKAIDFRVNPEISYSSPDYGKNSVVAICSAYMTENEITGLTNNANGTSTGAPDLFRMIKLNRLAVTLGYGKYSEQTKIKITSYREGIGEVTWIPISDKNDWVDIVSYSYLGGELPAGIVKKKACLLETITSPQEKYEQDKEEGQSSYKLKVEDLIPDTLWCEGSRRKDYEDHNISIDSTIYELAPHKPLVIKGISDTQHYSSQVKLEIISESGDLLNFGGFLAELYIAPTFFDGADGENLIEMGSC